MNLKGKVALVTGAASGLGLAVARRLAAEGASVLLNDIDGNKLNNTFANLSNTYKNLFVYACDITDKNAVQEMSDYLLGKSGRIDILVNNAGITRDSFFHKMEDDDFDRVIRVNLYGTYNCSRVFIQQMRNNNSGRIINISSVVGISGNMGQTNYAASKAAIIGFTKALALESAAKNITVNAVAPGFISTEMTEKIPEKVKEKILEKIPMAKFGCPDDIASMVCFLASEEAGYITGQVISINGGYLM
jgi:3-oxoacyl-[acyl-carrier protein] reductase